MNLRGTPGSVPRSLGTRHSGSQAELGLVPAVVFPVKVILARAVVLHVLRLPLSGSVPGDVVMLDERVIAATAIEAVGEAIIVAAVQDVVVETAKEPVV